MAASIDAGIGAGLEVRGMHCERGQRVLIDALDFDVPAGSVLTVVGPNGSGKTTLLRALAGLTQARVRRVAWRRVPIALRSAAWRAQLAYVGHQPGHKDELTAAENLELACVLQGGPAEPADRSRVLDEMGLAARSQLQVKRLSQGQKQRLALARLALSQRSLWLLDEPAAALDVQARDLLATIVARHIARGGTALIATHDPIDLPGASSAQLCLGLAGALPPAAMHAPAEVLATARSDVR